ncbi:hypothetical protein RCL1_008534 [Eukaryota sp. TZLM3-RCL]
MPKRRTASSDEELKKVKTEITPVSSQKPFLGAHVSSSGFYYNALHNAAAIGANGFALFIKSQRQWAARDFKPGEVEEFRTLANQYGFSPFSMVAHASYLLNLASPNPESWQKSIDGLVVEVSRCIELGIGFVNFHPGSSKGEITTEQAVLKISTAIEKVLEQTEALSVRHNSFPILLIENTVGSGNVLGGNLEEIAQILNYFKDKNQWISRVGVCIDTAHLHGYGYDISNRAAWLTFLDLFERLIGLDKLKCIHLNDSLVEKGSKRDRHQQIGKGTIGIDCFRFIMTHDVFKDVLIVLETPGGDPVWTAEIEMLRAFQAVKNEVSSTSD